MLSKTILITGATSGIGTETVLELAKQGHAIYMLVRNATKGDELKNLIIAQTKNNKIFVVECDLTNLASVSRAANEIKSKLVNIHVLINNAGGIFPTRQLSNAGFEMTLALNHIGHFFLTLSLMPLLEKGQARIINLSSEAHKTAKVNLDDLEMEKKYSGFTAYSNAKLFNIYFAKSLAERFANKGITAYSVHPGLVKTNFGKGYTGVFKLFLTIFRPFMISAHKGAQTSIYLATEPKIEFLTGNYFKNKRVAKPSAAANNYITRQDLWVASEAFVKKFL